MTKKGPSAASAPGKVLLAGGYLVVDRAHTGLVFGLSARIHVHIEALETTDGLTLSEIIVRSPQFRHAEWRYGYRVTEDDGGVEVVPLTGHSSQPLSRNKFVETALAYALTYISAHTSGGPLSAAKITILADSDYYSQGHTSTPHRTSATGPPSPFENFNVALSDAHKTGLGSSAALVTAFTAAVLDHYLPAAAASETDTTSATGRRRIHNLAQAAHCTAQGKIGSGFDVAAAVYGSCIYRRFSPAVLTALGDLGSPGFGTRLTKTVDESEKAWDHEIVSVGRGDGRAGGGVTMPRGLRLVLCDVDCGSETPGMVKKVFEWRTANAVEAGFLWALLQQKGEELAEELGRLAVLADGKETLTTDINVESRKDASGVDYGKYWKLHSIILIIRSLIRHMSLEANVPIEPPSQTTLLNSCTKLPGVIGGVVPGAGGYDAVALIVEDREEIIERLNTHLKGLAVETTRKEEDHDGSKGIRRVRLLGVRQDMGGVNEEDTKLYSGWIH